MSKVDETPDEPGAAGSEVQAADPSQVVAAPKVGKHEAPEPGAAAPSTVVSDGTAPTPSTAAADETAPATTGAEPSPVTGVGFLDRFASWWEGRYTFTGTAVGLLFVWLSLTPSLLPRGPCSRAW
jgi:hypothetical protein